MNILKETLQPDTTLFVLASVVPTTIPHIVVDMATTNKQPSPATTKPVSLTPPTDISSPVPESTARSAFPATSASLTAPATTPSTTVKQETTTKTTHQVTTPEIMKLGTKTLATKLNTTTETSNITEESEATSTVIYSSTTVTLRPATITETRSGTVNTTAASISSSILATDAVKDNPDGTATGNTTHIGYEHAVYAMIPVMAILALTVVALVW